jgi:hypothetical protein
VRSGDTHDVDRLSVSVFVIGLSEKYFLQQHNVYIERFSSTSIAKLVWYTPLVHSNGTMTETEMTCVVVAIGALGLLRTFLFTPGHNYSSLLHHLNIYLLGSVGSQDQQDIFE